MSITVDKTRHACLFLRGPAVQTMPVSPMNLPQVPALTSLSLLLMLMLYRQDRLSSHFIRSNICVADSFNLPRKNRKKGFLWQTSFQWWRESDSLFSAAASNLTTRKKCLALTTFHKNLVFLLQTKSFCSVFLCLHLKKSKVMMKLDVLMVSCDFRNVTFKKRIRTCRRLRLNSMNGIGTVAQFLQTCFCVGRIFFVESMRGASTLVPLTLPLKTTGLS